MSEQNVFAIVATEAVGVTVQEISLLLPQLSYSRPLTCHKGSVLTLVHADRSCHKFGEC